MGHIRINMGGSRTILYNKVRYALSSLRHVISKGWAKCDTSAFFLRIVVVEYRNGLLILLLFPGLA